MPCGLTDGKRGMFYFHFFHSNVSSGRLDAFWLMDPAGVVWQARDSIS